MSYARPLTWGSYPVPRRRTRPGSGLLPFPHGRGGAPLFGFQDPDSESSRAYELIEDATGEMAIPGVVLLVEPGSLPNDGKVIEDARSYK